MHPSLPHDKASRSTILVIVSVFAAGMSATLWLVGRQLSLPVLKNGIFLVCAYMPAEDPPRLLWILAGGAAMLGVFCGAKSILSEDRPATMGAGMAVVLGSIFGVAANFVLFGMSVISFLVFSATPSCFA